MMEHTRSQIRICCNETGVPQESLLGHTLFIIKLQSHNVTLCNSTTFLYNLNQIVKGKIQFKLKPVIADMSKKFFMLHYY
jgi:hypothetical protein